MVSFAIYILSVFGLSYYVGCAKVTEAPRSRFDAWLHRHLPTSADFLMCGMRCPACTSWWFGLLLGLTRSDVLFPLWNMPSLGVLERAVLMAFTSCAATLIIGRWIGLIK